MIRICKSVGHGWERRWAVLRPVPQPRSRMSMLGAKVEVTMARKRGRRVLSSEVSMDWSMLPSVS